MEVNQGTSSKKRTYSQNNQEDVQNKCLSTRSRVSILDKPNEYAASGLKKTLHGNIYQLKLLMLFLKRGLDDLYSFRLATEMNAAEKFDDLVFQYENERNDGIVYRFLQAKHKRDESKKITANDLLTEKDEDFSLQKYFISYRKIKQNSEFNGKNDKLKDFVIYTNIDLDDDLQNSFEKVAGDDNILDIEVQNDSKKPKRLKFKKIDSLTIKDQLISIFQETSDLNRLAKKLVEHVFTNNNDKTIDLTDNFFKKYHRALVKEVIDIRIKKCKPDFIDDSPNLSEEVKKFRKVLLKKSKLEEDVFNDTLKNKILKISKGFGNQKSEEHHLPNDEVSMEEIDEFLEKLVFAVNQPNEYELGKIINDEIGKEFNNIDKDNVYSRFQEKMLDWMKEKRGRFISYEDGKDFFEEVKKEILGEIWFDVLDPVEFFTGRSEKLKELHDALQSGKRQVVVQTAISGLGGIGKSQLAKKYAYEYREEYDNNVIWINAEKYETMVKSFLKLATDNRVGIRTKDINGKEKRIRSIVEEIYRFFEKRKSLFIFDNAERYRTEKKEDNGIDKFLPLSSAFNKPNFIITSRNQKWKSSVEAVILLDTFTETESIDFIKKSLSITNNLQDEEIKELAEILQHFPLALQQAVAYIKERDMALKNTGTKFDINNYLKRYNKETKKLLDFKFPDDCNDPYTKTTFITWKITTDKIKENNEYGKQAEEILDIIAYFAPDSIPVEMFLESKLIGGDKEKLGDTVQLLKQYSMVSTFCTDRIVSGQKQKLNVHRLVQQVTRINLKDQNREVETLKKGLEVVEKNKKEKILYLSGYCMRESLFYLLVNHAISAWSYASEYDELVKEFSNLPRRICKKLHLADCKMIHLLRDKMLYPLQKVLGDNHLEVAILQRYVGDKYSNFFESGKKEALFKQALSIFKKHLDVAKKQNAENLEEKKEFFKQALSIFEMDFELVKVQNAKNLDDERQKKWIRMLEIELAKLKNKLGFTYGCLGVQKLHNEHDQNYCKIYYNKKIKLLKEVLLILKKHDGLKHKVAKTLRNLGNAYCDLGNLESGDQMLFYYEKRIDLLEEAFSILREHYYGLNYFEAVKALISFCDAYRDLDNLKSGDQKLYYDEKKKKLLEEALSVLKEHYSFTHFEVVKALRNFGDAYCDLNLESDLESDDQKLYYYEEKKKLLEEALSILRKHYNLNYSEFIKVQRDLDDAYRDLGDLMSDNKKLFCYKKRKKFLKETLSIFKKLYEEVLYFNYFEIVKILNNLSDVHRVLGELKLSDQTFYYYKERKKFLEEPLPDLKEYNSYYNVDVAKKFKEIGNAYGNLGDLESGDQKLCYYKKRKKLLEDALSVLRNHYSYNFFEILKALRNFGNTHSDLSDLKSSDQELYYYCKTINPLEDILYILIKLFNFLEFDDWSVADILYTLGDVYNDLGNLESGDQKLYYYKKEEELHSEAILMTKLNYLSI